MIQLAQPLIKNKHLLVTGGTGSFGNEIVQQLLTQYQPATIVIMSRDEKKQHDMQQKLQSEILRFCIGDVRDYYRVRECMRGIDIVFHAAALKQVPNCEYAPMEAVNTNILGANNIRRAAIEEEADLVVAISTDKAVKPVNVMGMSKAIQERVLLQPSPPGSSTKFVCVRYGNVLGSRGSVVPLFQKIITAGEPLPITHPEMTRFQLTLKQAVHLVFSAASQGQDGDLWVRKMPAAYIADLGRVLAKRITGQDDYPQEIIGVRPGEKLHEVLVSEEEMWRAKQDNHHFVIPNWSTSTKKLTGTAVTKFYEYSSKDTHLMSDKEINQMLEEDGW